MSINKRCSKCRRPQWSLGKKNPYKVGDIVTLPRNFTFGRRIFKIFYKLEDDSFGLMFVGGKERGEQIERYDWWDLKFHLPRREGD